MHHCGATISIITNEIISIKILAFIFAVGTTLFVFLISKNTLKKNSTFIILVGMNINYLVTSIVSLLMIVNRQQLDKIVFWTLGGFAASNWSFVLILAIIVIPTSLLISIHGKYMNAIALDEKTAKSVGINTNLFKAFIIISTCLITATCVSVSGIIGFVGLMIPHIVRLIFTNNYKYLIILSGICGGIFLLLSDNIARTIMMPSEVPIGIITSIIGAPYLIYLIYKKYSASKGENYE